MSARASGLHAGPSSLRRPSVTPVRCAHSVSRPNPGAVARSACICRRRCYRRHVTFRRVLPSTPTARYARRWNIAWPVWCSWVCARHSIWSDKKRKRNSTWPPPWPISPVHRPPSRPPNSDTGAEYLTSSTKLPNQSSLAPTRHKTTANHRIDESRGQSQLRLSPQKIDDGNALTPTRKTPFYLDF